MEKNSGKRKAKGNIDFQGYGLRDNPKKSWKSLGFDGDDNTTSSTLEFQCKACGKGFESTKALFGHMRHHSGREKKEVNCQECGRKFKSLKALTGHMRLHPVKLRVSGESVSGGLRQELALETRTVTRKRSKRMRYNSVPNSSLSSLNESSGLVEIDQEMDAAAVCLIMLSRGVRNWAEFNSFWESCDNDSEIRSFHQNKEIMQNSLCDGNESFQIKKPRLDKSDSDASASMNVFYDKNISECKELDSGIMSDKDKNVGSEVPNNMIGWSVEISLSKVDDESGFELYDTEIEERISSELMTFRSIEVEPRQDLMEGLDLAGLESKKSSSCKDAIFDARDSEPRGDFSNKLTSYKCKICSKTFKSHQALGGHQTIHRKGNSCAVEPVENCENITHISTSPEVEASCKLVKVEYFENSVEQETNQVPSSETRVCKVHKCGICLKVFASGQALGGHKRSHILKDPGTSDKQPAKQLEFYDISAAVDLNLPVIHNEEANGDTAFKPCRIGSDCKSEALLSLVAN